MGLRSVLIDTREPPAIRALRFGDVPVSAMLLDAGDLLATTDDGALVLIERKVPSDLLSSLADDRLFSQAGAMPAITPWSYLVVTGRLEADAKGMCVAGGQPTMWQYAAIQGALLTVQELGVGVYCTAGADDYAAAVVSLSNRGRGAVRTGPLRNPLAITPAACLLTAFPGIGDIHAQALLEYCGSAAWAIQYLSGNHPLGKVPGVGPGARQRARAALGLEGDYEMAVVMTDEAHETLARRAFDATERIQEREQVTI